MAHDDVVRVDELATAEEMLSVLSPSESRWRPDLRRWMFRGLGSACHELVPRILRGPAWRQFLGEEARSYPEGPNRDALRKIAEFAAVHEFMLAADHAGLAIPEDSQALRSGDLVEKATLADMAERFNRESPWPTRGILSVVALAQHYGVATRLLDWTWRPRVAAYFAAERVTMSHTRQPGDRLAVWAVDHRLVTLVGRSREPHFSMQIVTAPQATNPYLAAQAGVFTLIRDKHEDVSFDSVMVESIAALASPGLLAELPAMWKLTPPHSEAPRLLRLLGLDGLNAATVYPGYAGVARSLKEQRCWQQ